MAMKIKSYIAGVLTLFFIFSIVPMVSGAQETQLVQDSEFDMQPAEHWKAYEVVNEPLYSLNFQDGYAELSLAPGTKESATSYYYGTYQNIGKIPTDTKKISIIIKNGDLVNADGSWTERIEFWYSTTYWSEEIEPLKNSTIEFVLNQSNAPTLFSNLAKSMYFIVEMYFTTKPGTSKYELDLDYVYANFTTNDNITESLIIDPGFEEDWHYWSYEEQGSEQWGVSFENDMAVISGAGSNSISAQNPASCLLYQTITVPNGKIENATLKVYVAGESNVKLKVGFMSNNNWLWSSTRWAPQSAQELSYNVTDLLNSMAGESIVLEAGALVDYNTSNGDYSFLLKLDYVRLYVVWSGNGNNENSNNGWNSTGASSWSGGGATWSGRGMYWWSNKNTANATYVQMLSNRIQSILTVLSSIIVAALWIRVGADYFSSDLHRKARIKSLALKALFGTIMIILAVLGSIWMISVWATGL